MQKRKGRGINRSTRMPTKVKVMIIKQRKIIEAKLKAKNELEENVEKLIESGCLEGCLDIAYEI